MILQRKGVAVGDEMYGFETNQFEGMRNDLPRKEMLRYERRKLDESASSLHDQVAHGGKEKT